MKILAIGAHPDDIEIFMYGFLAICKNRGDQIIMAIATDGAAGNVLSSKALKETRRKETLNGLKKLGVPVFLDLPDGQLSFTSNAQSVINEFVKETNPNLIITHSSKDYHPDHRALCKLVTEAAGFKSPIIFSDTLMGVNFLPDIYVDITPYFIDKKDAILCHKSQRPQKFVTAVKIWNSFRAAQCNAPEDFYAESYRINKTFPFSDIRSILPVTVQLRPFYSKESDGLI